MRRPIGAGWRITRKLISEGEGLRSQLRSTVRRSDRSDFAHLANLDIEHRPGERRSKLLCIQRAGAFGAAGAFHSHGTAELQGDAAAAGGRPARPGAPRAKARSKPDR